MVCLRPFVWLQGWSPRFYGPGMRAVLPRWQANRLRQLGTVWPLPFSPSLPKAFSMHILTLLTPPASEPISLAEAKLFLRIDEDDEDALVVALIAAARTAIEEATNRSLLSQNWTLTTDHVNAEAQIQLPRGPVATISTISALDAQGNATPLTNNDWVLLAGGRLLLKNTATGAAFRVQYQAGYASASAVPAPLVQAVRMLCGHLYEDRGATELPASVAAMIAPFRLLRV